MKRLWCCWVDEQSVFSFSICKFEWLALCSPFRWCSVCFLLLLQSCRVSSSSAQRSLCPSVPSLLSFSHALSFLFAVVLKSSALSFPKQFYNNGLCMCCIWLMLVDECTQLRLLRLCGCSCYRCSSAASVSPEASFCSAAASHAAVGCLFEREITVCGCFSSVFSCWCSYFVCCRFSLVRSLLRRISSKFAFRPVDISVARCSDSMVEREFPWFRCEIASSFGICIFIARITVTSSDCPSRVEGRCWCVEMFFYAKEIQKKMY